jgi:hypothetical protein
VGPLLTLLASGTSKDELARYLRKEIDEHFGLPSDNYDFTKIAERVQKWFERGWRNFAEPTTIFVPLLEEGVDVWRPVQARRLDRGLFRIIGIEADTRDETWRFPAGAIVRCEDKRFADGTSGITAVEQIGEAG